MKGLHRTFRERIREGLTAGKITFGLREAVFVAICAIAISVLGSWLALR